MQRRGQYRRWASEREQDTLLPVFRQYCPVCRKSRGVLAAFLRPYARHVTLLRETVARARVLGETLARAHARVATDANRVSLRTVQRWWAQTRQRAPAARDALAEQVVTLFPAVNPVDVVATAEDVVATAEDVVATAEDAVATLLRLGRGRQQRWVRAAPDRQAWSIGLFGLCNVQGWVDGLL